LIAAANPGDVIVWFVPGAQHCGASAVRPEEFRQRVLQFYEHAERPAKRG
jgi:hypothetical protein